MIMKAGWTIKMPKQVPPAVSNQFTAMIPSGIILTGSGAFNAFAHTDFLNWIYNTLQIPLQGISDSFGGALAIGFLVPFFLTPLVVAASTYLVIKTGIVPPLNGAAAPWTTPAVIFGFLIGGWKMAIWQFCTLLISTAIYWPFAKKYDKVLLAKEQKEAKEAK